MKTSLTDKQIDSRMAKISMRINREIDLRNRSLIWTLIGETIIALGGLAIIAFIYVALN